jgi:hypothetical protein
LKLMLLSPIATTDKKTGSLDTKPSGTVQQTDFNAEAEKVLGIDGFVVEGQITTDEQTGLTWQREQVWRSWEEANSYCQTEHYGLSGWRLPKEAELAFLYQRLDSSKNRMNATKIFPSLMRDHYWSGDGSAISSWSVNFRDGKRTWRSKSGIAYVRCVRGTKNNSSTVSPSGFVLENQTVTDLQTGLVWHREQVWRDWKQAKSYCLTKHFGFSGWRLPKEAELSYLYQRLDEVKNRMAVTKIFPSLMRDHYWSGDGSAISSWSVNFRDGKRTWRPNSSIAYVRCVRDTT